MSDLPVPWGWLRSEARLGEYVVGIEPDSLRRADRIACIRSRVQSPSRPGLLLQSCRPGRMRGHRIRLSALVEARDVAGTGALLIQVLDRQQRPKLALAFLDAQLVEGTCSWTLVSVEAEVSDFATQLDFGAMLWGTGSIRFAEIRLEAVERLGPTASTTGLDPLLEGPGNLDFSLEE